MTSTVGADACTNTWHFTATAADEGTFGEIKTALTAVYENIDTWKSNLVSWSAVRCKIFNMSESEPRVPVNDALLATSSAPAGSPLPPEVAVCLSYNGAFVSGYSQARRRGRIYLGPLNVAALTTDGRFSASLVSAVADAGADLILAGSTAGDWAWVVYSPSGSTSYPVEAGWCDNAPDIQRRRGVLATTRTLFT